MSRQQELDRLDRAIKDADIRLKSIKNSLEVIDKEINQLTVLEVDLEQNLTILKQKRIIAMAAEYRKAKLELERSKSRLAMLKVNRNNAQAAFDEMDKFLLESREAYAKILKEANNNVLKGKFGKKDG